MSLPPAGEGLHLGKVVETALAGPDQPAFLKFPLAAGTLSEPSFKISLHPDFSRQPGLQARREPACLPFPALPLNCSQGPTFPTRRQWMPGHHRREGAEGTKTKITSQGCPA